MNLSIWLLWLSLYLRLGNNTIRYILGTQHLNIISTILCFDIFSFEGILSLHHILLYFIRHKLHCTADTLMLYFIDRLQYSYQHDYWLFCVDSFTLLQTVWGNHRVFMITVKNCKCSILQLVLLQFYLSCQYFYILLIISFL